MPVHVAITRRILPGKEQEFHEALRQFMGKSFAHNAVHGAGIITFPQDAKGESNEIGILRTFASNKEKEEFYNSPLFREWEAYASTLTEGEPNYRELTGLEAWFRTPGAPPRWKMAIATFIGVYPTSLFLIYTIGGLIHPLPIFIKSLIMAAAMVGLLTWIIMPQLTKALKPWLHK